jgi:hypothetical protein
MVLRLPAPTYGPARTNPRGLDKSPNAGVQALLRPDESGNHPVICGWLPQPSGQAVTVGAPQSLKWVHIACVPRHAGETVGC